MTFEIALVLGILAGAVVLFVSERVRVDLVALLVLVALALSGLIEPRQALAGFSNPAVVTVWAVFILSGALARTGVAGRLGRQVLKLAGRGEARLVALIMITAGVLSAFMNNVGVAALLLPVVMDIAKRTGISPSRLLIPLASSSLLGGLTTMIGTPPNLLISDALRESGLGSFGLFDFAPVGSAVLLAGILFMALIGRRLLPDRATGGDATSDGANLVRVYGLQDQLSWIHLPVDSVLAGKTLAESRLGSALDLNVIGIVRRGEMRPAPPPRTTLQADDRLLVVGELGRLAELQGRHYLDFKDEHPALTRLISSEIEVVEVQLIPPTPLLGQSLREMEFRQRFGVIVLAIRRAGEVRRTHLEDITVERGDVLLVQGPREQLDRLREQPHLSVAEPQEAGAYRIEDRLMVATLPQDSALVGKTLVDSRLGDAFGLGVMGIVRSGHTHLMPDPRETLQAGDTLLLKGKQEELTAVEGLQNLEIAPRALQAPVEIESDRVGLAEVVLSPRSTCAGKTLRELRFRERFGLNVIALSRGGKLHQSNLRDLAIRFGDALLVHGPRERLGLLGSEPDFLVLSEEAQEPVRTDKAPLAALLMLGVVASVVGGLLPIYIAAVAGAALMVLTRCLTMDEAYRAIEWKAVFLIAGMLPLGMAMEQTGAARWLTDLALLQVGDGSPLLIVAAIYVVTALGAQVMPTSAVAILMAPIALNAAADLGLSPAALLMTVALSASASFMSPIAHPANVLIMGPGGYRFSDYAKVGFPLTVVCLLVVLLVLPRVWPLVP